MSKVQIYSAKGTKTGTLDLPKELMSEPNQTLLAQTMHVYEARSHKRTSKVKTRGEVNASGAKIYKQKGTGRARHGDIKAPIFAGGGIAHGPKAVKRTLNLSKSLKNNALKVVLGSMTKNGRVVVVDKLESINKTKDAQKLIDSLSEDLGLKRPLSVVLALSAAKSDTARLFRNIKSVSISNWQNLNPYILFNTHLLMVDKEALTERNSQKENAPDAKTKEIKAAKNPEKTKIIKKPTKKVTKKPAAKRKTK